MNYDDLIKKAFEAQKNSYSPYSNFAVGCAILTENNIYIGSNIENASYGATICAERVALHSLISNGENKNNIKAMAIVSSMLEYTYPCSLCRQTMVEFLNEKVDILMVNKSGDYKKVNIDQLVPYKFTKKELKNV